MTAPDPESKIGRDVARLRGDLAATRLIDDLGHDYVGLEAPRPFQLGYIQARREFRYRATLGDVPLETLLGWVLSPQEA